MLDVYHYRNKYIIDIKNNINYFVDENNEKFYKNKEYYLVKLMINKDKIVFVPFITYLQILFYIKNNIKIQGCYYTMDNNADNIPIIIEIIGFIRKSNIMFNDESNRKKNNDKKIKLIEDVFNYKENLDKYIKLLNDRSISFKDDDDGYYKYNEKNNKIILPHFKEYEIYSYNKQTTYKNNINKVYKQYDLEKIGKIGKIEKIKKYHDKKNYEDNIYILHGCYDLYFSKCYEAMDKLDIMINKTEKQRFYYKYTYCAHDYMHDIINFDDRHRIINDEINDYITECIQTDLYDKKKDHPSIYYRGQFYIKYIEYYDY